MSMNQRHGSKSQTTVDTGPPEVRQSPGQSQQHGKVKLQAVVPELEESGRKNVTHPPRDAQPKPPGPGE